MDHMGSSGHSGVDSGGTMGDAMNMDAGDSHGHMDMVTMATCVTAASGMGMDGHSVDIMNASCGSEPSGDHSSADHSGHMTISDAELYIEAVLLIITIGIGTVVNIIAIIVIIITPKMRTGTFLMLANLCIMGLFLAAIAMPVHVTSVVQNKWTMEPVMCNAESYLIAISALVSVLTHTEVAIVRYCAAVAPQHVYKRISSWKATIIWIISAWVLGGALVGMGIGVGIVVGKYSPLYSRCTPINMDRLMEVVIAGAVVILFCYAVITFCYVRLFVVIKNKVESLGQANSKQNVRFVKVTKTLLVLSVVFIICWLPFLITCGADPHHTIMPIFLHRISHDIAEILSCINPIFYFMRIDEFKTATRKMFNIKASEISSTDGASTAHTNNKTVTHSLKPNAGND